MAGTLHGRVAFITGVARGQGRAHAIRLAREGVDIIGVDICENNPHMNYPLASPADLEETVRLVEREDARIVARKADVCDFQQLKAAFDEGYAAFGRVDIILANAGITRVGDEQDPIAEWQTMLQTNLTGPFHTVRAALPAMREAGRGGSIVFTSSTAGLKGYGSLLAGMQAYTAAKRGLVGYMQTLAVALGPENIRVNTIHPTGVRSGMTDNEAMEALMAQARKGKTNAVSGAVNALPIEMLDPEDIAGAVAWLVSDDARFITGIQFPLDAGYSVR